MKTDRIIKYTAIGSAAAVILMMAAATVVEKLYGTERALSGFYHSPVFIALWAVAAVAGLWLMIRRGTIRKPATFLLHISFMLILAGALITMLTGSMGMIHLRQGFVNAKWSTDEGMRRELPFTLKLEEFSIEYYPGSEDPSDYRSRVVVIDSRTDKETEYVISMNHILKYDGYRFYQSDYDEDLHGSILSVSHDPWGVGVTYTGYLILLISLAGFFFQKNSGFRNALKRLKNHGNTL